MTSQRDENIAKWFVALEATQGLWQSLDVRTIALHIQGEWHNLVSRVRVDARAPDDVPRLRNLPETEVVAAWQEVQPMSALRALVKGVLSGSHPVDGHRVWFVHFTDENRPSNTPYAQAWTTLERMISAVSIVHQPPTYVAHSMELRSGQPRSTLSGYVAGGGEAVRQALQAAEHPWEGIEGLARVALEFSGNVDQQSEATVEFIAPLGLAVDQRVTRLQGGTLRVGLWAASPEAAANCTVGYIAEYEDRSFANGTLRVPREAWSGTTEVRGSVSIDLRPSAKRVALLARLGPYVVQRHTVTDMPDIAANPHLSVHLALDTDLAWLRSTLTDAEPPRGLAAEKFEHAVGRLFSISGFHVDVLGKGLVPRASFDVLARTPDGLSILVIECTLEDLNTKSGKPGRLFGRVADLRESFGSTATFLPIMATRRKAAAVSKAELSAAGQDGIAVLAREDLSTLLDQVTSGATFATLHRFCRDRIPITGITDDGISRLYWGSILRE